MTIDIDTISGVPRYSCSAPASALGGILIVMVGIWFVLGCLIDSISIILLTVPIFAPIATQLGFDPIAFCIMGILAIETGLLTPPFGILVFTVKAAVPDKNAVSYTHLRAHETRHDLVCR